MIATYCDISFKPNIIARGVKGLICLQVNFFGLVAVKPVCQAAYYFVDNRVIVLFYKTYKHQNYRKERDSPYSNKVNFFHLSVSSAPVINTGT